MKKITLLVFCMYILSSNVCYAIDRGMYFGIGVGRSSLDVKDFFDYEGRLTDNSGLYYKVFGGKRISDNFSVESGYVDFGEFSGYQTYANQTDIFKGDAFFFTGVINSNFKGYINIFGRYGLQYWSVDVSANSDDFLYSGETLSGSGSKSDVGYLLGVGIDMEITSNITLRIEGERYDNVGSSVVATFPGSTYTSELSGKGIDVISLNFVLRF